MRSWNGICFVGDEDDVEVGGTIVYTCQYYRLQYDDTDTVVCRATCIIIDPEIYFVWATDDD